MLGSATHLFTHSFNQHISIEYLLMEEVAYCRCPGREDRFDGSTGLEQARKVGSDIHSWKMSSALAPWIVSS